MAYKAGNLELQLTALSSGAVSSLDTVITKLTSLSNVLKSVTTTDMKWINSFGTKMKNLSKKLTDIDWSSVDSGFNRLTVAITPFIDKVNSAQASLTAMYGVLQKVNGKKLGSIMNVANGGGKSSKGGNSLFNFGKLGAAVYLAKRMGQAVANIVQYGTDFTETLNLWQVAMRDNLDQADEFIKKMNKAYSISQKTLMNAQATFKNMIGSLGNISDTVAYQLSESILQMAVDFSSLYNVTFENAITKFQAVLAGQVRPIRSVSGYDITETTLYQVYQQLGGTKTQRQLNRTEKQLLSIYAVFQQMQRSGAVGDLSKTLDNFANQSRMMTENFKELKTYVGLFFQDLLQSWGVLKYINAGLIFLTEIVKALTKYEAPNFIEGMFDSTVAENEALDELQGKLLDFDKFRALDSTSTTSDLAIDQTILDAVSQYQSILENVNNEARNLAETWLEAFGFTKNEDGELSITEKKLTVIKVILGSIVGLLGGIVTLSLIGTVKKLIPLITSGLTTVKNLLSPTRIAIMAIAALLVYLYNTNEHFRDSVNNLFKVLLHALNTILTPIEFILEDVLFVVGKLLNVVAEILSPILDVVSAIIKTLDEMHALEVAVGGVIAVLLALVAIKIAPWINAVIDLLPYVGTYITQTLLPALKNLLLSLNTTKLGMLSFAVAAGLAFYVFQNWDIMNGIQKVVAVLGTLTVALLGAAVAFGAFHSAWSLGLAIGGIAAGIIAVIAAVNSAKDSISTIGVNTKVNTSSIDSGVLSNASSVGRSASTYTGYTNNSGSGMDARQMKEANYQGTLQALKDYGKMSNGQPIVIMLDGQKVFESTTKQAKRFGLGWQAGGINF